MKRPVLIVLIPLIFCSAALAQEISFPQPQGYISDFAGTLNSETQIKLSSLAAALEQKTGAQLAVVTLDSTKPYTIDDYAVRLFETWGIGQEGKDNGVLLLVAVADRKVRIEVGYGLEGRLTDALSKRIIENVIIPAFKKGELDAGVFSGSVAIINYMAEEYNVALEELNRLPVEAITRMVEPPLWVRFLNGLFTLLIFLFFISMRMGFLGFLLLGSGRRRGGYWFGGGYGASSGGFGGGFGGFGGGLSGGGGASGGW